ncbi:MAG: hypothetical protein ACOCQG_01590 [Candidatus Nanoarchaeia archaeon]
MTKEDIGKILGLGNLSMRKSYYKDLKSHQFKLEQFRFALNKFNCPIVFFEPETLKIIDKNETFSSFFENEKPFLSLTDLFFKKDIKKIKYNLKGDITNVIVSLKKNNKSFPFELTIRKTHFRGNSVGICLFYDISQRLKYEKELKKNEQKYRTLYNYSETIQKQLEFVINKAETLVVAIDNSGKIIESNINQFKPFTDSIKNKNIFTDEFKCNSKEIINLATSKTINKLNNNLVLSDKKGRKHLYRFVVKKFKAEENKNDISCIIYGKDLTHYRENLENLVQGSPYIYMDEGKNDLSGALKYLSYNYKIFHFSRDRKKSVYEFVKHIELNSTKNPLNDVYNKICELTKKNQRCIFYIERFDFLRCFASFHELMKLIFKINDIIKESENIIIYFVKNKLFSESELEYLKNECFIFNLEEGECEIEPRKLRILQLLSLEGNAMNCSQISRKSGFSRKTIINWINEMELKGLLFSTTHGRSKYLKISEKGNKMLGKNA